MFRSALRLHTYLERIVRTRRIAYSGPLDQAGSVGVVVWNFIMSMELYLTVAKPVKEKSRMYKCFARYPTLTKHVFAWILVFIFTVGPLVNDEYGQVGEYCWIKSNRSNSDAIDSFSSMHRCGWLFYGSTSLF